MKSSITKRWVSGSLLFTIAVVLVAEGVFLFFTLTGYYDGVERAIENELESLRYQMTLPSTATADERRLRLISTVEQYENRDRFELMLVTSGMAIETTSSGVLPTAAATPAPDVTEALAPGGESTGRYVGANENGERVMAVTVLTPYAAGGIVAMRLVTSLTLVDNNIRNLIIASVALFAAIILASVISGLYFISSIVRPLHKVETTAARIAQGDFDTRIDNRADDEIGALCKTINHMAEALSQSERMKNEFISSVSHELRTPLTAIKGWTETVSQLSDPSHPSFRRGIDIIAGEADRLYDMVEELLDFSRIENGLSLSPELLDLAAEVEEAVLLSGQRAASLGVALLYAVPELPVPVMADRNRIRQVLVNVLDNAVKYSFTGGEVDIEILQDERNAYVVVTDEGQGISPEDLESVKQKFYKGKGAVRGSGIGLAVADEIMSAHGGQLSITSELNRGTQVTLRLALHHKNDTHPKETEDGTAL